MQPKDIADMMLKIGDSVNFLWYFYAFGIIAIVSWLLTINRKLSWQLRLLLTFGFLCFVVMNLLSLLRAYVFLDSLTLELQAAVDQNTFKTSSFYEKIRQLSFGSRIWIAWGIHLFIDTCVLVILWSKKARIVFQLPPKAQT